MMKFRHGGIYYIPDLVWGRSYKKEYCVLEEDSHLNFILNTTTSSLDQLFQQYPMVFQQEFILEDISKSNSCVSLMGAEPKYCYHYLGEDSGIYQGVRVEFFDQKKDVNLFWIKVITNRGPFYQCKVLSCYDMKNGCLIPNNIIEVKKENEVVIQQSYAPKVLKKKKLDVRD